VTASDEGMLELLAEDDVGCGTVAASVLRII
jgi:hypothetical protein